ncbi:hypothetical protein J2X66_005809 [Pseudomonas sp. 3296]|jgi:hypothetical protein|uniref:hypothetical protein n=1 Tax=Pseudomonas sp. 3296 TaxID=2817753 RepID=UPI002860B03A|nr:hypothetical protein [Pseudomonas sp. 3296]MDR6918904.1 hypothetical protein [Pseudomonas sp. 3296]
MSVIDLPMLKQQTLDELRHDLANLEDETAYQDLSQTQGFHQGRLRLMLALGGINEAEHDQLELELLQAIIRERERRDS